MDTKRIALFICILVVSLLISSCGAGQLSEPTDIPPSTSIPANTSTLPPTATLTPIPTETSTSVPPTSTPISAPIGEVQTQQGVAVLTSVEHAAAWPQGCDPKADFGSTTGCFLVPNSGYELLIVNFMPKESTVETIDVELDANINVKSEDGQLYQLGSVGHSGGTQMVVFAVPPEAKGFTLFWEANPPISLP
jgi:hypothetical protein